jgi:orotidine-5'-phosphate decarboxylase
MKNRLIVALDTDSQQRAEVLVDKLYPMVKIFKIGSQLFTIAGPKAVAMVQKKGAKVFLDLKFHDIPNTVASAVRAAKAMGVFMLNVHASGGSQMMKEAVSARGKNGPLLLAVTVLTSLDKKGLKDIGVKSSPVEQVKRLALLAKKTGMGGVVCSAQEIEAVRKACKRNFIIVTPGIRPKEAKAADQKRVQTPEYAASSGADYIVVGRPITEAKDPYCAARAIIDEIA